MMKSLRHRVFWLLGAGLLSLGAAGQALPTATAPSGLTGASFSPVGGTFRYTLSASESLNKGLYGNLGTVSSTNFSGSAAFLTVNPSHPFSMIYSGGYLLANSGQQSPFYQNLAFSQALTVQRWEFVVSDSVNYVPQTPATGLSGIPGVGDLGSDPVQVGAPTGLGVLTAYGPRVNNSLTGNASRAITGRLSLQAGGYFTILRFLGDTSGSGTTSSDAANSGGANGLDSTAETGSGGFSYRTDKRSTLGGSYNYSRSSFSGSQFSYSTQGVSISYNRQLSRQLSMAASGGPLWVSSPYASTGGGASLKFTASASVVYTGKVLAGSLSYVRGTSSGSGVTTGVISDSLSGDLHRSFGHDWRVAGTVSYARTGGLLAGSQAAFSSEGVSASGQVSRSIGRYLSGYASYTLQDQLVRNAAVTSNAFNGLYQVAGFGITYTPSVIHVGPR